ncbi:MAG: GAF domain-containing protein [Anaerolineae bacterium]
MNDQRKTKAQLIEELQKLRQQVAKLQGPEKQPKRVEETLRESEERLRTLLDSTPSGIVVIDAQTHEIVDVNPAAIEMIGAPPEQVIGSVCHHYICPAEKGRCPITDLGQTVDNSERVLLNADGRSVPILKTVASVMLDGREHLLESFIDITERKETEAVSIKLNRELAALNRVGQALISALDLQETLTVITEHTIRLLGVAAASVALLDQDRGDLWFAATSGEGSDFVRGARLAPGQGIAGWVVQHSEAVIVPDVSKDTRFFGDFDRESGLTTRSVLCVPLQTKGQTIGAIEVMNKESGAFDEEDLRLLTSLAAPAATAIETAWLYDRAQREITERKRVQDALRVEKAYLEQLFEGAPEAMVLVDTDARILRANNEFAGTFGYTLDEVLGQSIDELLAPDDLREEAASITKQVARGERTTFETVRRRKDGTLVSVSILGMPVEVDGEQVALYGIYRDITERKTVEEEIRHRSERLALINEVGQRITPILDLTELYQTVVEAVQEKVGYQYVAIFSVRDQEAALEAIAGFQTELIPSGYTQKIGEGMVGWVAQTGETLLANDVTKEPRFLPLEFLDIAAELDVPIRLGDKTIGVLAVDSDRPNVFTEADVTTLETIADQVARATENARLFEDTRSRLAQLTALQETTRAVASTLELDKLLNLITQQAATLLQGGGGIINLVDWENREEEVIAASGSQGHTLGFRSPLEGSLSGWVTLHNQPVISNQLRDDDRVDPRWRSGREQNQNAAIAPLTIKDQVMGTLVVMDKRVDFDQADLDLLIAFANQAATAIENARLYETIQQELAERKRAEEALRESEERFRLAIEAARDGLWENSLDHKRDFFSDSMFTMLGYEPLAPADAFDFFNGLVHPDDFNNFEKNYNALNQPGHDDYAVEIRLKAKDGTWRHILSRGKCVERDEEGRAARIVGIHTDITDLKRAEEALQRAHEELERRAAGLERRTTQLQAAAEVAREATAILDVQQLLDETVRLVSDRFGFYHAGIFLVDERGEYAVLRAAFSEGGRRMLERGHKLKVGEVGIVGYVAAAGEPRVALDVGEDAVFFDNPDLPDTRSEMALPLVIRGRVIGALDVQSTEPAAFSDEDVITLQTMADQLAVAIENARLVERTEAQVRELSRLYGEYSAAAWAELVSAERPLSYVYDRVDVLPAEEPPAPALDMALERGETVALVEPGATEAVLAIPLKVHDQVIGSLGIQQTDNAREWFPEEIALVEAVSDQVAMALENARLFEEARTRAEELAVLNELGQALTTYLSVDEVVDQVYRGVSRLLDTTNFYVALYDPESNAVSFPLSMEGGQRVRWESRQAGEGLTEYLIHSRQPLLMEESLPERMEELGIEMIGRTALSWLGVPLMIGGRVLGVMAVQSYTTPGLYDEHDRDLLTAIASQAAIALQNARLFEETRIRAEEMAVLNELGQALTAHLNVDQVLEETYRGASRLLRTPNFYVALYDPEKEEINFAFDVSESEEDQQYTTIPADQGLAGYIIQKRASVLIQEGLPERLEEMGVELVGELALSWLGVPLIVGERVLGAMAVQDYTTPHAFDEHDQDLLTAIASQAAIALQNARLFEETRRRARQVEAINEVGRAMTSVLDPDVILHQIVNDVKDRFGYYFVNIAMIEGDRIVLRDASTIGDSDIRPERGTVSLDLYGAGLVAEAARAGEPVLVNDVRDDPRYAFMPELPDTLAELCVPIKVRDRVIGVLDLESARPNDFDQTDLALFQSLASQAGAALENARLFEEARTRAEELAVLNELGQALTARLNVEQVLDEAYRQASRLVDTANFYIGLYDPEKDEITFPFSVSESEIDDQITVMSASQGLTGYIIRNRTSVLLGEDASEWEAEMGIETVGQEAPSWLGVPLMVGDRALGVMAVQSYTTPGLYDEHDRDLLTAIASQVAIALQNARLFEETRVRAEELAVLNELGQALTARLNVEQVLDEAYRGASRLVDTANFYIALYDPDRDEVTFALDTLEGELRRPYTTRRAGQGLTEYIIRNRQPLLMEESLPERMEELGIEMIGRTALSWLGVPLMIGGRVLGVMAVQSYTTPGLYDEHDRDLLMAIASQAAIALQNARLFEDIENRLAQLTALQETTRAVAGTLELDELLNLITQQASTLLQSDGGILNLVDWENEEDEVVAAYGSQAQALGSRNPLEGALSGWVTLHNQPVISNQLRDDSRASQPFRTGELGGQNAAIAPLTIKDQVMGTLVAMDKQGGFDQADLNLLMAFANQAAIAIQNARLFEETQARAEELAVLNELGRALTARLNVEQVLDEAYRQASRLVDTTNFFIALYDPERHELTFDFQITESEIDKETLTVMSADEGVSGYIVRNRTSVLTQENVAEQLEEMGVEMVGEPALSWLGVPLMVGDQVLGVMAVQSYTTPGLYDEHDRDLLTAIASQAAIALQNARLFEETQRRATQLATAAEVARDATAILDVDQLLDEAVHRISERFGFYHAGVFLLDERDRYAVLQAASSEGGRRMLERGHRLRVGEVGIVGYVAGTGEPRIALDVGQDAVFFNNPDLPDTRSEMALPLKVRERVIGVLDVQSTEEGAFSEEDVAVLQTMADQLATAIANARLFQDARADAMRRALINEMLQTAAASLDPEELLHRAGEVISHRLEVPSAVFTWEPEEKVLHLVAVHAADATDVPLPEGLEQVTREMNPVLFEAVMGRRTRILETTADLSGPLADVARRAQAQSAIYVPLVSRNQVLGVLDLSTLKGQPLVEAAFAELVAANLSVALENARLFQDAVHTAERLAEVDRLKSQFLANMSHELRTPLNSIIGFSRVILKEIDGPLTDMQRTDLQAVYDSGQHLLRLINDILDISKIEAGKMELSFEAVDLKEAIEGVMATAIALVKDKPIELQQSIPEDLPKVRGDERRIRQVLLNLVSNAEKFTEAGFIRVEAEASSTEVTISVADSGIGIAPEKLDSIFDPFIQVDASTTRRAGGTGLGLSITREFVEMHGGRIWVESGLGKGSTFYFTLPIKGPPLPSEEVEVEQPEPEPGQKVVLCVEDDEGVITLFRRYLSKQGYQVIGLTDSTVAVERARKLRPFAITLDVMMPGKDGWQVIQELKSDPETRHIPVILCTILSEKERGLSLGASDYLIKPILEEDLVAALDHLDREAGRHLVLVVDDQPEDRNLLRRMIEACEGYEVMEAAGGQEAITLIRQTQPHIIILDLIMPEVDGFAVLEAVKADETTRSIPIVVVTAKDLSQEERDFLTSRVEALLQKGLFEQGELLVDVAAALKRFSREGSAQDDETG